MKKTLKIGLSASITALLISSTAYALTGADIKIKSDLRVRSQYERRTDDTYRFRERIRFRLGGSGQVNETTSLHFGIATGGSDPRSTNQTLDEGFQTGDFRLDHAFAQYEKNGLLVRAGKIYFYSSTKFFLVDFARKTWQVQ